LARDGGKSRWSFGNEVAGGLSLPYSNSIREFTFAFECVARTGIVHLARNHLFPLTAAAQKNRSSHCRFLREGVTALALEAGVGLSFCAKATCVIAGTDLKTGNAPEPSGPGY
jgi:hypothetical protein